MAPVAWLSYLALLVVTYAAARIDLRTGKVPNRLTYPAILAGLIFWPVMGICLGGVELGVELSKSAWLAMACGLIPYAILVLTAGLGGGDMKLMAAVGAISASWEVVLSTTVYALIAAVVLALAVMVRRGIVRRTASRLFSAALLASARVRSDAPADSPQIAFAAAIAVGAALAGAEQLLGLQTPWRALAP